MEKKFAPALKKCLPLNIYFSQKHVFGGIFGGLRAIFGSLNRQILAFRPFSCVSKAFLALVFPKNKFLGTFLGNFWEVLASVLGS